MPWSVETIHERSGMHVTMQRRRDGTKQAGTITEDWRMDSFGVNEGPCSTHGKFTYAGPPIA